MTDRFDLTGRRALVTGSSRGIGRAIALGLAEQGADVCVHCKAERQAALDVADMIAAMGRRTAAVAADIAQPGASTRLFNDAAKALGGPPDIIVVNAAIEIRQPFEQIGWDTACQQFDTNVMAGIELVQAAIPAMRAGGWGRIVTVGSVQEHRPNPQLAVYAAMKSALFNLVRNLAMQLGADGITVNTIAPGVIETDMNKRVLQDPSYRSDLVERIPSRSFGDVSDCVGAVILLCSEAGRYITGSEIYVDGGLHLPQ